MNRFLTLLLMSSLVFGQGWTQTTFNVDMTCAPEGFENVFVTGPWCGWCANDTYNTMTDPDGDGVYTAEVPDLAGVVEYKYAINGFADQENLVNDMVEGATCAPITDYSAYANRQMDAGSVANDYYGTCNGTCNDFPPPPGGTVLFRVDMSEYVGTYGTVNLNGAFNGWCGACATMTDDDGDMIYELAVDLPGGTTEYKFTLDGWNIQEDFTDGDPCTSNLEGYINRTLDVTGDMVLPAVCWNSCAVCASIAQCDIDFDFGEAEFGTSPDAGESFMSGVEGSPYYDIWHFLVPMTAAGIDSAYPPTLPIDSLIVLDNGVDGNGVLSGVVFTDVATNEAFHPEEIGLEVLVNNNGDSPNENTFLGGNQYCTAFQGVPSRAGQYDVTIDLEAWATIFTPFNFSFTFQYQMLVVDPNPPGCTDPQACNYNPDSAEDDGSCVYGDCPVTLWDVIVNSPDHTLLEAALLSTGVYEVVDTAPLTVVAPTDEAFSALLEALEITFEDLLTVESLFEILLYHFLVDAVYSVDLSDGQFISTVQGSDVIIGINQDGVFVNDAQITVADIAADNGVLHVIDQVLLPPPPAPTTVVDIVANNGGCEILEAALVASGLEETLLGEGPFTVFAPTDAAFAELSMLTGLTINELLGLQGLTDLLLNHVVGANALSTDLSDGQSITTLLGDDILVTINATGVFINDAQVVVADLVADNGVVHVIDAVIVNDESIFEIVGCMDPLACNFMPFASTDDGSCEYPGLGLCCNGGLDLNQNGICDELECGQDGVFSGAGFAIPDNVGECVSSQINVSSILPGAVIGDAASEIEHFRVNMEHSFLGDLDVTVICPNGQTMLLSSYPGSGTYLGIPILGDNPPDPGTGYDYFWSDDAPLGTWSDESGFGGTLTSGTYTSETSWSVLDGCPINGTWALEICDLWASDNGFVFDWGIDFADGLGWSSSECCDFDEDGICDDEDDCVFCGCTDESALNYDAEALVENGSCIYFQETCQFIGEEEWANIEMGVYAPDSNIFIHGEEGFRELVLNLPLLVQEPATGQTFAATELRYLVVTGLPPGLDLLSLPDSILPSNQACLQLTGIPEQVGVYEAEVSGELEVVLFGQPFVVGSVSLPFEVYVLPNPNPIAGCAYPNAVNYLAYATVDNGSCLYAGCTDPEALNYYSLFVLDDGSCIYGEVQDNTCPTDVDADGVVSTTDLLELLGSFGTLCY